MTDSIKGRIVFLDYMRVFAFVSVLIGHKFYNDLLWLAHEKTVHITIRTIAEILLPFCQGGAAGVVIFFLTSGYIITHVLQSENPKEFVIKRLFRIYPLYIVAILLQVSLDTLVTGWDVPPASVLIPRLLLIGDFFGTPYALAGVEWTLRIEIMFYALMCSLKYLGMFNRQSYLPVVYILLAIALYFGPVIPYENNWAHGYFNLYAPFLLIGSCVYLAEVGAAKTSHAIVSAFIIFAIFLSMTSDIQPAWKNSNFAAISVALFMITFFIKWRLPDGRALIITSNLTYSVYLFHNWLWGYLALPIMELDYSEPVTKALILVALLAFCYAIHKTIENYGIATGRWVLKITNAKKQVSITQTI